MTSSRAGRVELDDLIALNDQIAALIRTGIPLELGLREAGRTIPGELGRISERLGERMTTGASLAQALDQEGDHVPAVYRAVIEAGQRAGRLPEALEALSSVARSLLEMHRQVTLALIYPVLVAIIAWLLLTAFVWQVVPEYEATWASLRLEPGLAISLLSAMHRTLPLWSLGVPLTLLALIIVTKLAGSQRLHGPGGRLFASRSAGLIWFPAIVENYCHAIFARLMALLLQHQVTLPEALLLAAHATGHTRLIHSAGLLAEAVRAGQSLAGVADRTSGLGRFLRWLIKTGAEQGRLGESLALAGDVYASRAVRQSEYLRVMLPLLLTLGVGGTVTFLYSLTLFGPTIELYSRLAVDPTG